MRILHISTTDRGGGAGIAAYRLSEAMNAAGIDSRMLVLSKETTNPMVIGISDYKGKMFKYFLLFRTHVLNYVRHFFLKQRLTFSCGISHVCGLLNIPAVKQADVIYIHWVGDGFANIKDIGKLAKMKHVYLFAHDMWYLTGGCHHSFDCNLYERDCNNCPMIERKMMVHYAKIVLDRKKKWWHHKKITVITPSSWLNGCIKRSSLFSETPVFCIPNTFNENTFNVFDKKMARKLLGLPLERKLILFGAVAGTNNPYKGWIYTDKVMKNLRCLADLVVFGSAAYKNDDYNIISVGRVCDESSMSLLYNAVDVYISSSLAESFGQTIVEAIACGTPAVAFAVGGVNDIIQHKSNGYLVKPKDIEDYEAGILWALKNVFDNKEKERLHESVSSKFGYNTVVRMHVEMFNKCGTNDNI